MLNFSGRWFTSFGPMELAQEGDRVRGFYSMQQNSCPIEGSLRDGKFHFTYREPAAEGEGEPRSQGEGFFELARHDQF